MGCLVGLFYLFVILMIIGFWDALGFWIIPIMFVFVCKTLPYITTPLDKNKGHDRCADLSISGNAAGNGKYVDDPND